LDKKKEATSKCKLISRATKETQKSVKHSRKIFYSTWKAPYCPQISIFLVERGRGIFNLLLVLKSEKTSYNHTTLATSTLIKLFVKVFKNFQNIFCKE
jgi:hypothetical protein